MNNLSFFPETILQNNGSLIFQNKLLKLLKFSHYLYYHLSTMDSSSPSHLANQKNEDVLIDAVQRLNVFELSDNVPNIQFPSLSVEIDTGAMINKYEDNKAFHTKFGPELEIISQLDSLSVRGEQYVSMLYSFRSISKAIPMLAMNADENATVEEIEELELKRTDFNKKIIELLRPEIVKLKELINFINSTIAHFKNTLEKLAVKAGIGSSSGEKVSEGVSLSLIRLIDLLLKIDNLKDMKAAIKNDFSRYKRAVGALQNSSNANSSGNSSGGNIGGIAASMAEIIEEQMQVQTFINNPDPAKDKNYIFVTLREDIKRVNGHENVLIQILNHALFLIYGGHYVTPNEKFQLIRVLPHLLLLIDGNSDSSKKENVFRNKNLDIVALQNIFKQHPVVPLYADMSLTLIFILQRAGHYDPSMFIPWGGDPSGQVINQYDLTNHWQSIKDKYDVYIVKLIQLLNANKRENHLPNMNSGSGNNSNGTNSSSYFDSNLTAENINYSKKVFEVIKEGLSYLSEWSCMVLEMLSWKYTHPCERIVTVSNNTELDMNADEMEAETGNNPVDNTDTNANPTNPGIAYERALKYNFSKSELNVLVDIIAIIKSLSALLHKHEANVAPIVRFHMHHAVQQLVQGDLLPILHRCDKRGGATSASKNASRSAFNFLIEIRQLASDWKHGKEPIEDYKQYSRKQGAVVVTDHIPRVVSCSTTQLVLLRTCIRALYDEDSDARHKQGLLFTKTDLERVDIELLQDFYYCSQWYPYLLTLGSTIREVSNLSDLVFREFYLDLTKCIQFPIEMSLPWILTEHVIVTTGNPSVHGKGSKLGDLPNSNIPMIENILYVLDIYNDAAHRTLYELKQQYLYDEIEAEANLVFDQLIFLLSDEIYSYYKNYAASMCIDFDYKDKLEEIRGSAYLSTHKRRYEILLTQKHIQLLGRSIDLNYLITQHINNKFYNDLEFALKRYESGDVSGIVELQDMLLIIKKTYTLLSTSCELDPWDNLLNEVNESYSPTAISCRMTIHTMRSLIMDIFTNYSYNAYTKRFVKSPVALKVMDYNKAPRHISANCLYGDLFTKAYELKNKMTRGFVGRIHLEAIIKVIGLVNITIMVDKLTSNIYEILTDMKVYMEALHEGIPPSKLPQYVFQSHGCYGYFEGKLKGLLEYEDLKPEVFQGFREIGNTIAFFKDLSVVVGIHEQFQFIQVAPYLNISPEYPVDPIQFDATNSSIYKAYTRISAAIHSQQSQSNTKSQSATLLTSAVNSNYIINSIPEIVSQLHHIYTHVIGHSNLFSFVMKKVEDFLYQLDLYKCWGVAGIDVEADTGGNVNSLEFHRMWSAMNCLFSVPDMSNVIVNSDALEVDEELVEEIPDDAEFGDGFNIAGCLIIHLLGQKELFELYDYSTHILNVYHNECCTSTHLSQPQPQPQSSSLDLLIRETGIFINSAKKQQQLQTYFFNYFNGVYSSKHTITLCDPLQKESFIVKCVPPEF